MARLRTTGRKCDSGVFLVLEHCRKRPHVHLLHFPARSGWHPGVSAELDDLHPQFNADPEAQIRFHRCRAVATSARSRLTDNSPQPSIHRCISKAGDSYPLTPPWQTIRDRPRPITRGRPRTKTVFAMSLSYRTNDGKEQPSDQSNACRKEAPCKMSKRLPTAFETGERDQHGARTEDDKHCDSSFERPRVWRRRILSLTRHKFNQCWRERVSLLTSSRTNFLTDQRLAAILDPSFPMFITDHPQLQTVSAVQRLLILQPADLPLSNPLPSGFGRGHSDDRRR